VGPRQPGQCSPAVAIEQAKSNVDNDEPKRMVPPNA
jgi:hypothetical protein